MVVTESQVEPAQFPVCVASIYVNARIVGHEVESFVENGKRLVETAFLEEARAHVVVGQPDLCSHIVLQTFCVHELGSFLQITQGLIKILSLSVYARSQQQQFGHIMEKLQTLPN
jgi:hypothetical protein